MMGARGNTITALQIAALLGGRLPEHYLAEGYTQTSGGGWIKYVSPEDIWPSAGQRSRAAAAAHTPRTTNVPMGPRQTGNRLGLRHSGDPWALARAKRIPVQIHDNQTLRSLWSRLGPAVPYGETLMGFTERKADGSYWIHLRARVGSYDKTLAHELAHVHDWSWREDEANAFAEAFMARRSAVA